MEKSEIITYAVLTALGMALLYCMMWLYTLAVCVDSL
jgi:hypothetical protein